MLAGVAEEIVKQHAKVSVSQFLFDNKDLQKNHIMHHLTLNYHLHHLTSNLPTDVKINSGYARIFQD